MTDTPVTTETIVREIGALKEILETRFNANEKAVDLLQKKADSMPTPALVQADVEALAKLTEAQFKAMEEAGALSDRATRESLSNLIQLLNSTTKALSDRVSAQERQLIRLEEGWRSLVDRTSEQKVDQRAGLSAQLVVVGILVSIGLGLASLYVATSQ